MNPLKKSTRIFLTLLFVIPLIACGETAAKVIDPSDPAFEIAEFKISDYKGNPDLLREVFRKFIPIGTKKTEVDKLIGDTDYTEQRDISPSDLGKDIEIISKTPPIKGNYGRVTYYRWSFGSSNGYPVAAQGVIVFFDKSDKVLQVSHLGKILF